MESQFDGYSLTTGVVRRRDLAYLVGAEIASMETSEPRSRVFVRSNGKWIPPVDLEWNARSITVCKHPAERVIAISEQGYVLALGGGQVAFEQRIAPGNKTPGPLTEVRSIGGVAYAIGTLRQVYARRLPAGWQPIDAACRATGPDASDFAFRAIDGFSESDVYAAGWEGEIWHYDGKTWTSQHSPTNLALYCLRCAGDGAVYAVGQRGVVVRGRRDLWETISHEATEDDLWGCEWFEGRLFVASQRVLYELRQNKLIPTQFGSELPPSSCYHLSAADGIMWSIGPNDVMEFDGSQWSRLI